MVDTNSKRLQEQILYYKARADEYDDWYLRLGRYDYGKKWNNLWFKEVGQLNNALKKFNPQGRVLEIACGTGWWTQELLKYADSITALDPSPEVLEINQKKLNSLIVRYVQADIFAWKPKVQYDVVFFSFWISHVPPKLFKKFWNIVHSALTPDGRVFFIDNFQSEKDLMAGKQFKGLRSIVSLRKVKDEREFNVIKIFYDTKKLKYKLQKLGWKF